MFHSPFNSTLVDVPRPHVDPICTLQEALAVVSLAARHPMGVDTILLQLDRHRRGVALSRVSATPSNSLRMHDRDVARVIVEQCSATALATQVVLVTFRPATPVGADDVAMLGHLRTVLASAGFHLLDWVVVGRGGFYCPRVLTDAPDPWTPLRCTR